MQSEVSSISFSASENEIIAGSSRGVINVWDIKSQKSREKLIVTTFYNNNSFEKELTKNIKQASINHL